MIADITIMNKEQRKAVFQEYLQLKQLPFLSKEQAKRLRYLDKQRKINNRIAFNEDLQKR